MKTAMLYRYGDINYWTGNYAEGGKDLLNAGKLERSADDTQTIHIRPAQLTAERRKEVDISFESYIRLNRKYEYQTGEQAFNGDKARVFTPVKQKKSLLDRVIDFFYEEVEE